MYVVFNFFVYSLTDCTDSTNSSLMSGVLPRLASLHTRYFDRVKSVSSSPRCGISSGEALKLVSTHRCLSTCYPG